MNSEPDELDKLISERWPDANEETRATLRKRIEKRTVAHERHEKSKQSIESRILAAPNIESVGVMRAVIGLGLSSGQPYVGLHTLRKQVEEMRKAASEVTFEPTAK